MAGGTLDTQVKQYRNRGTNLQGIVTVLPTLVELDEIDVVSCADDEEDRVNTVDSNTASCKQTESYSGHRKNNIGNNGYTCPKEKPTPKIPQKFKHGLNNERCLHPKTLVKESLPHPITYDYKAVSSYYDTEVKSLEPIVQSLLKGRDRKYSQTLKSEENNERVFLNVKKFSISEPVVPSQESTRSSSSMSSSNVTLASTLSTPRELLFDTRTERANQYLQNRRITTKKCGSVGFSDDKDIAQRTITISYSKRPHIISPQAITRYTLYEGRKSYIRNMYVARLERRLQQLAAKRRQWDIDNNRIQSHEENDTDIDQSTDDEVSCSSGLHNCRYLRGSIRR